MSIFEGIEHVQAEGISNRSYFEPGNYTVAIEKVFLHEKRLGGGKLFIVETKVLESDNPNIKAGEQRNWVQTLGSDYARPRIKTFIGTAMGLCPKNQLKEINQQIGTEMCNGVVSSDNPLKGKKLALQCINKATQAGKIFTQHVWEVIHGQA